MRRTEQLPDWRPANPHTDSLLTGEAERLGKAVSEVIRDYIESALPVAQTASDAFLAAAHHPPKKRINTPERAALRQAYRARHSA